MLAGAALPGCHSRAHEDPAAALQSIERDFLHGNLDVARTRAEHARRSAEDGGAAAGIEWAAKFRLLEAEILTYQGRAAEVIPLLTAPGLVTSGDAAIKRHLLLGLAYSGLGRPAPTDSEMRAGRQLAEAAGSILWGEVLRTEALVQVNQNHLADATDLFRRSLDFAREHDDRYLAATDLLNIGFVTLQLQHYDEAITLLQEAAKSAEPIQARTVIEAALGNIGEAYLQLGDFERALANYQQAELQAEAIGTTSAQVEYLQYVGLAYYKLGNLDQARQYDERALAAAAALSAYAAVASIESNLAFLWFRQGQVAAAQAHSEAALRAAHQRSDPAAAVAPRFMQALLVERQGRSDEAERLLRQVQHDATADVSLRWDIENALAGLYAGRHATEAAETWYRRSIETFEGERAAVKDEALRLSFFANGDTLYRDYAAFLIDSGRPKEALQLLDRSRARTLEEGLGANDGLRDGLRDAAAEVSASAADAQTTARAVDGCILFYALGAHQSYLWAVTAESTTLFRLPGQAELESLVDRYQKAILRSSDPLRDANPESMALFDALLAPARSIIPKNANVFLIRDGVLNRLNFETLLSSGAAGPHYWIDDVTVANASSIRLLARRDLRPPRRPAKTLLLIGDPVSMDGEFERLPNAAAEIDAVKNHFIHARRTVVTQAQAVPSAYPDNRPEQFSYIHFVAHGTANRLDPLDSAVVLSPARDRPESSRLYARDIARHPLRARLVIISACYGSGLRAYSGEGLVGLAWAFLRAGSHDVIGASWEANDASTPLMMDRLYGEIEDGKTASAALRSAKLSLIHSSGVYRKPLYWGAFQLYAGS